MKRDHRWYDKPALVARCQDELIKAMALGMKPDDEVNIGFSRDALTLWNDAGVGRVVRSMTVRPEIAMHDRNRGHFMTATMRYRDLIDSLGRVLSYAESLP